MSPGPLSPSPPLPLFPALGPLPLPLTVPAVSKESFQCCAEARFNVRRSPEIQNYSLGTNGLFAEESQVVVSGWTCWWFRWSAGLMCWLSWSSTKSSCSVSYYGYYKIYLTHLKQMPQKVHSKLKATCCGIFQTAVMSDPRGTDI